MTITGRLIKQLRDFLFVEIISGTKLFLENVRSALSDRFDFLKSFSQQIFLEFIVFNLCFPISPYWVINLISFFLKWYLIKNVTIFQFWERNNFLKSGDEWVFLFYWTLTNQPKRPTKGWGQIIKSSDKNSGFINSRKTRWKINIVFPVINEFHIFQIKNKSTGGGNI